MTGLEYYRIKANRTLEGLGKAIGVAKQTIGFWEKKGVRIPKKHRDSISEETGIPVELLEMDEIDELHRAYVDCFIVNKKIADNQNNMENRHGANDELIEELDRINQRIEVLKELDRISDLIEGKKAGDVYLRFDSEEIHRQYRKHMLENYKKITDIFSGNVENAFFFEIMIDVMDKMTSPDKSKMDETEKQIYSIFLKMKREREDKIETLKQMQKEVEQYRVENRLY